MPAQPRRKTDPHRRAEERSIAYHRVIAERLLRNPTLLDAARNRVRQWLDRQGPAPAYARAWDEILVQDIEAIAAALTDPGEYARELRQSSPFAGYLSPRERWAIWRQTRDNSEPPR